MIENVKKTTKLAISAIFVALITVGAFIKIPIPGIPFTLQVLFTTMAGLMLGGSWGAATVATYTLMGLIGLPVFTVGGGLSYVLQPTFGYILGFIVGAGVCGAIVKASKKKSIYVYIGASLVNMVIIYVLGVVYFYFIMTFYMGEGVSVKELLVMFFSINIIPDTFKCVLASILSLKLGKVVNKICVKSVVTDTDMDEVIEALKEKALQGEALTRDEQIILEKVDLDILCSSANDDLPSGDNDTKTEDLLTTVGLDTESDREMLVELGIDTESERQKHVELGIDTQEESVLDKEDIKDIK